MILAHRFLNFFSKMSKPKPKAKQKQYVRSFATGDQKAAKLSKSEQELQNKNKAVQAQKIEKETIRKISVMKTHNIQLEQFKSKYELERIKYYQNYYLGSSNKISLAKQPAIQQKVNEQFQYLPIQQPTFNPQTNKYKKYEPIYGNYTRQINSRITKIQEFQGHQKLRRNGTLGIKMGMTTMYNRWGQTTPVTIVLLDRVQVVQIKAPLQGNTFYQVQMGLGQKRLKKLTKSQIGHFMKAKVPPKSKLAQFPVSKQCLLPVGYMISARHYTPGMFVDIAGKTVGHGFQGTIKRFGFKRQPATHGNSLTTRVLGSTGGRQDPGRVFKQKKMYGRMGGKISVQKGMTIFKIDVDKNILYIKGSIPGKAGTLLKIWDTLIPKKGEKNLELTHFPTFVQRAGVQYARQFSMYCGQRDPAQIQVHDNAYIIDDGQQDAVEKDDSQQDKQLAEQ